MGQGGKTGWSLTDLLHLVLFIDGAGHWIWLISWEALAAAQ